MAAKVKFRMYVIKTERIQVVITTTFIFKNIFMFHGCALQWYFMGQVFS